MKDDNPLAIQNLQHYTKVEDMFPLGCALFDWEYHGDGKFGRYAVCKNTQIARTLSPNEFYGNYLPRTTTNCVGETIPLTRDLK